MVAVCLTPLQKEPAFITAQIDGAIIQEIKTVPNKYLFYVIKLKYEEGNNVRCNAYKCLFIPNISEYDTFLHSIYVTYFYCGRSHTTIV